ncbi:hypothetical protein FRC08_015799 [Ceratobasidium sp. 394]|nr:hypothetical protein FRC08_015799 [Ceratobasidium sp. 394]
METNKEQQKRDDNLNKTIKMMNGILVNQRDKLRNIEELVQAVEEQVTKKTFKADLTVRRRSSMVAPAVNPTEGEDQDPPTLHSRPTSPFEGHFRIHKSTATPKRETIPRRQSHRDVTFMNQTTAAGVPILKEARTKKPERFSGQKGKEAEAFLMRMEIYFRDYDEGTFSNGRKITALLMNMALGGVADWAQPLLVKVSEKDTKVPLKSWKALKAAFSLHFTDPVKKERVIRRLSKLVQTKSAQAYATQFWILIQEVDWNQEALVDKFREGLKPEVQKELR